MKLELKHLAPYLPYGLIYVYDGKKYKCSSTIGLKFIGYDDNQDSWHYVDDCKPILRPLSDLTKEIEVNGEKFVPIEKYNYLRFEEISNYNGGQNVLNFIQVREHNLLLEMHFDVFGLIPQGLAIDINTLER